MNVGIIHWEGFSATDLVGQIFDILIYNYQKYCLPLVVRDGETCNDLKADGKTSGYYTINPDPVNVGPFEVYCDMEAYPGTGDA